MMPSHKMKDKNYKSLGYCIYCLIKPMFPEKLTEEHIIANALGGTLRFKEAACKQCAQTMNEGFEQPSLKSDFLVPRLLLELRAKKRKTTTHHLPPVALGAIDISKPGVVGFDTILSKEHYPKLLYFSVFDEPGVLNNLDYGDGIEKVRISISNISDSQVTLNAPEKLAMQTLGNPYEFGMAIVKIAYAFAVAECGIDAFEGNEIRDLLAYKREDIRNYFGCPENYIKRKMHDLHHLSWNVINGNLVVKVHLFSSYGAAPYIVVVGKHLKFVP